MDDITRAVGKLRVMWITVLIIVECGHVFDEHKKLFKFETFTIGQNSFF